MSRRGHRGRKNPGHRLKRAIAFSVGNTRSLQSSLPPYLRAKANAERAARAERARRHQAAATIQKTWKRYARGDILARDPANGTLSVDPISQEHVPTKYAMKAISTDQRYVNARTLDQLYRRQIEHQKRSGAPRIGYTDLHDAYRRPIPDNEKSILSRRKAMWPRNYVAHDEYLEFEAARLYDTPNDEMPPYPHQLIMTKTPARRVARFKQLGATPSKVIDYVQHPGSQIPRSMWKYYGART